MRCFRKQHLCITKLEIFYETPEEENYFTLLIGRGFMDKYQMAYDYRPSTCPGGQTITYYDWGGKVSTQDVYTDYSSPS